MQPFLKMRVTFAPIFNMSLDKLTDQQALLPMLHKLTKEIRAIMTEAFNEHGIDLSKEQAIVLKKLLEQNGRPQHDLALVTSRDKTSLTRLLSTMERKGLIYREQMIEDKRVNLVFMTEKGRTEIDRATPVILGIINQAISGIDEKRIQDAKVIIKEIYENLNLRHDE